MSDSLRSRVVEAGVDAIINDRGIGDVIVGSDEWVMVWEDVVVALEAMLDCLTEAAPNWPSEELTIHGLIGVLREDR